MGKQGKKNRNRVGYPKKEIVQQQIKTAPLKTVSQFDKDEIELIIKGAMFLFLIVVIAYIPAIRGGYMWDDDHAIKQNVFLRTPEGLWNIWFEPSLKKDEFHYSCIYKFLD